MRHASVSLKTLCQQEIHFFQLANMSQDSKEWIKTRMAVLKKQAGFAFNQDLFISILLCFISGRDKHLILTAPPDRLAEVTQMASQVTRYQMITTLCLLN